jgi:hypothetical protein
VIERGDEHVVGGGDGAAGDAIGVDVALAPGDDQGDVGGAERDQLVEAGAGVRDGGAGPQAERDAAMGRGTAGSRAPDYFFGLAGGAPSLASDDSSASVIAISKAWAMA